MLLRNSQRSCYKDCKRKYFYTYVLGLKPKIPDQKLHLGQLIHEALAFYYGSNRNSEAAKAFYDARAKAEFEVLQLPEELYEDFKKDEELGKEMLKYYFEEIALQDNFEIIEVEKEFEVRLLTPQLHSSHTLFQGRVDGIIKLKNDQIYLLEHKTATSLDSSHLILDEQMSAYCWALRRLGWEIQGVFYNILRKVNPYSPRSKPPYNYREYIFRSSKELEEQGKQLYQEAIEIRNCKNFYRNPTRDCSWKCSYRDLCLCELDGSDISYLIEANYLKGGEL